MQQDISQEVKQNEFKHIQGEDGNFYCLFALKYSSFKPLIITVDCQCTVKRRKCLQTLAKWPLKWHMISLK